MYYVSVLITEVSLFIFNVTVHSICFFYLFWQRAIWKTTCKRIFTVTCLQILVSKTKMYRLSRHASSFPWHYVDCYLIVDLVTIYRTFSVPSCDPMTFKRYQIIHYIALTTTRNQITIICNYIFPFNPFFKFKEEMQLRKVFLYLATKQK